jgi:hypothetical protein
MTIEQNRVRIGTPLLISADVFVWSIEIRVLIEKEPTY